MKYINTILIGALLLVRFKQLLSCYVKAKLNKNVCELYLVASSSLVLFFIIDDIRVVLYIDHTAFEKNLPIFLYHENEFPINMLFNLVDAFQKNELYFVGKITLKFKKSSKLHMSAEIDSIEKKDDVFKTRYKLMYGNIIDKEGNIVMISIEPSAFSEYKRKIYKFNSSSIKVFYNSSKLPISADDFHKMELKKTKRNKCQLIFRKKQTIHKDGKKFVKYNLLRIVLLDYFYTNTLPISRVRSAVQTIEYHLKSWLATRLAKRKAKRCFAVRKIQRWWQHHNQYRLAQKQHQSAIIIQALVKGYVVRRRIAILYRNRFRSKTVDGSKLIRVTDCCICIRQLRKPVTNICGHSWCHECHQGLIKYRSGSGLIGCPICRQHVIEELKPNIVLEELITMLKT